MSELDKKLRKWYIGLRILSYVLGFTGVVIMTMARGFDEPARTIWIQRAYLCVGAMFAIFIANYLLLALKSWRKRTHV
ncbi:MAG TPA: hypothetical protein PJ991_00430 [Kiritimatiellia bacterium]|nr:hypothetical protein [Kiritimatiellia bacterium]